MDKNEEKTEVSLPSAVQKEAKSHVENRNLIKASKEETTKSGDKSNVDKEEKETTESGEESESDNEEIIVTELEPIPESDDVNLDDEFEKIVPYKFKKLSEESLDDVDHEIEEILQEAGPLGSEVKLETEFVKGGGKVFEVVKVDETDKGPEKVQEGSKVEESARKVLEEEKVSVKAPEAVETSSNTQKGSETLKTPESKDQIEKESQKSVDAPKPSLEASQQHELEKPSEVESKPPSEPLAPSDVTTSSTFIENEVKKSQVNDAKPIETNLDDLLAAEHKLKENSEEKPPVPIQTYLWEDIKRAKEQGGYPWTHLTKGPLGPDDDPQSILSYKQSPRAARKHDADLSSPKSQKKVRIQDEIEVQEAENYIQDLSSDEEATENEVNENLDDCEEAPKAATTEEAKKEPKSILKQSQKILETIKPTTSKFDSDSLKRKIKNPLQKIKKMADNQFKKVKSTRPFIKKVPVGKDEIILNDQVEILKLKESPKSQHREITSYVVKHQDSEDSMEILDFDESPSESRKRRENEGSLVTPDEIIELPVAERHNDEQRESTVESHEISISRSSSQSKKEDTPSDQKKREHVYEDIEDYISKITTDTEHVDRTPYQHEAKLQRQDQIICDPILDEFSREINKNIKMSLKKQDEKMKVEIGKKIPRIEELEKQISDEDREEKVEEQVKAAVRQMNLLAPISSIDSTSSDEASKAHLSILAEESESESLKKRSFETDESIDREIESLKNDESDISMTLMEDVIEKVFDEEIFKKCGKRSKSKDVEEAEKKASAEKAAEEKTLAEKAAEEKALAEKVAREKALAETAAEEKALAEKAAEEKALEEKASEEKALTEKVAREKALAEKAAEENALAEKSAEEKTLAEKASEEKALAEKAAEEKDLAEKVAPEKDLAEKAAEEKASAEKASEEKIPGEDVSNDKAQIDEKTSEPSEVQEERLETKSEPLEEADKDLKEDITVQTVKPIKISERWSKMSDHEYEPIGDPNNITDLNQAESQKRKISDTENGGEKKFLRTPTVDSEDNISAQDFQDNIESRFFKEIEPIVDDEAHVVHAENTFDEAVIIDESPVKREVPRKRNFMASAQDKGKNFQKKIKAQADAIKTSINNKMKKKPKEAPVAVEVAHVDDQSVDIEVTSAPETIETVNVQSASSEASTKGKPFNFLHNIKTPSVPKFMKPEISKPDFKVKERFSKIKKLGRSKSMKEESAATDSTSFTTPEAVSAEPTKKKFDFGTYPRMIRDKFKRPKLPERSDQSVRSETPPEAEFTSEQFAKRGPVASRWPEYDGDSGKYQQFNSESDLGRESSIERRMRLDYERSTEEREDFEIVARLISEEQRQMDEMEKENQEIHLMAKQERYKKTLADQQESDVGSEEDKMLWSGMLNKDTSEDFEEINALKYDDGEGYNFDQYKAEGGINRSYTPQTNQETQSSGSSGTRRRKGVFDDDDDYFMRETRVSNEIHIGEYISSAIKEGLSSPEENALVQMGRYERYEDDGQRELTPEKPTRSLKRKNKKNREERNESEERNAESLHNEETGAFDYYKTFPPNRPIRKQKKSFSENGEEIDLNQESFQGSEFNDDEIDDINDQDFFYRQQALKVLTHPDSIDREDYDQDLEYNPSNLPIPPTPPRRRKKKLRNLSPQLSNLNHDNVGGKVALGERDINVQRYTEDFVPLAREEHFTTPTPTPRRNRSRSRSQISSRTLDDATSFRNDSVEAFTVFNISDKENGYAQVRKEVPSRPVRRKRSTKSLGERQFATMPHMKRVDDVPPPRPVRNYSTIIPGLPNKPPRRKSVGSLVEISKTNKTDDDDYEEILDNNQPPALSERLSTSAVLSKMKDRPLPPPPRPKRDQKRNKKEDDDEKLDKDDNAERISEPLMIETNLGGVQSEPRLTENEWQLPRQDSEFSEPERVIEVEVSTQTDPVTDEDFACEDDEDIDINEFLSTDGKMKTLEDILKEEQEAEMERARQLAEAENLARGIQRFRDSSQRSMSEKSRTSGGNRSRSLSRPVTPSAVVVERKKSSPIIFENQPQTMTEAGLFIHPITYDDYGISHSDEEESHLNEDLIEPAVENIAESTDVNNNLHIAAPSIETQTSNPELNTASSFDELDDDEIIRRALEHDTSEDPDSDLQRRIEEMIDSVISAANENVDWQRESLENIEKSSENLGISSENLDETVEVTNKDTPKSLEVNEENNQISKENKESSEKIEALIESIEALNENLQASPHNVEPSKEEIDDFRGSTESIESPEVKKLNYVPVESSVRIEISHPEVTTAAEAEFTPKELNLPEAPQPPPRRRSTTVEEPPKQAVVEALPSIVESHVEPQQTPENLEVQRQDTFEEETFSSQLPSRLHLSSLEIDNLSVCSLQAGRITASEIDSNTIVTNEIECKVSSSLPNPRSIELPPGFIEEIVERVRSASRAEVESQIQQTEAIAESQPKDETDQPPARPPLPSQFHSEYSSVPPASFYQLRDYSDDEAVQKSPQRRRKHHPKRRNSTSEDDYERDPRRSGRPGSSTDQSVLGLGGQFVRACGNALRESGGQLMEILRASSKDENKRDLHIALIILIVICAGLILMGMGEKSVHHHHWDFFNPPDNHGRI